MLGYLLMVWPFENAVENFLQIFNEIVIISAVGHMFLFSDAFVIPSTLRVNAGWSFDLLIVLQILVNVVLYSGLTIKQIWRILKQKVRVFLHKRRMKKLEEERKKKELEAET